MVQKLRVDREDNVLRHCIAAYDFKLSGGDTEIDQSFRVNNANLFGSPRIDNGLAFNALDRYCDIPHKDVLNMDTMTIWSRCKFQAHAPHGKGSTIFLMKTTSTGWNDGYGVYYSPSQGVLFFYINRFDNRVSFNLETASLLEEVHDYCFVYDSEVISMYVDGSLVDSKAYAGTFNSSLNKLEIGRVNDENDHCIKAELDSLYFLNKAFPQSVVRKLGRVVNE